MKVKDIMTSEPKFCSPETKLHNAAKTMKSGNCGALPVIDKTKKVIGMITDRDIALSLAAKDPVPAAQRNVEDIMSLKIHTVKTDDDISAALRQKGQTGSAGFR